MSLRLINTETLQFLEPMELGFDAEKTPKYAILSHTWDVEEVSYQDMKATQAFKKEDKIHEFESRKGYTKIRRMCEMAASRSISHAWIDTCCIDKLNLPELSEAINNMFRWYQNAAVCYVWLADLQCQPANNRNVDIAVLEKCRWFTRGWCLQELVAPRSLEFFNAKWESIGYMSESGSGSVSNAFNDTIAKITKVPLEVLLGTRSIYTFPVACRMSWAAGRKTTKGEDMAYCLLGIFNVSMPMIYGEGGRHAFRRLQEHIIQSTNDLSIFAFQDTSGSEGPYYDFLASSPYQFEGYGGGAKIESEYDCSANPAFALTNKGIHFRRLQLEVDVGSSYSMRLNCQFSANSRGSRILLQKVAPGMYARCASHVSDETENLRNAITDEEAYIIMQVTPSLQAQLQLCQENAMRIRCNTHDLFNAVQVLQRPPSNNCWDSCKTQFLSRGNNHFRGYVKVFPSLAKRVESQEFEFRPLPEFAYLACGLERSNGVMNPWVRLYSTSEWRNLEAQNGIMTGLDDLLPDINRRGESSVVLGNKAGSLSQIRIAVGIVEDREKGVPLFNLTLDLIKESV